MLLSKSTLTKQVSLNPPWVVVAIIYVFPMLTGVMLPLFTVATFNAVLCQVNVFTVALFGVTLAEITVGVGLLKNNCNESSDNSIPETATVVVKVKSLPKANPCLLVTLTL